jgi:hypothetical protein
MASLTMIKQYSDQLIFHREVYLSRFDKSLILTRKQGTIIISLHYEYLTSVKGSSYNSKIVNTGFHSSVLLATFVVCETLPIIW